MQKVGEVRGGKKQVLEEVTYTARLYSPMLDCSEVQRPFRYSALLILILEDRNLQQRMSIPANQPEWRRCSKCDLHPPGGDYSDVASMWTTPSKGKECGGNLRMNSSSLPMQIPLLFPLWRGYIILSHHTGCPQMRKNAFRRSLWEICIMKKAI